MDLMKLLIIILLIFFILFYLLKVQSFDFATLYFSGFYFDRMMSDYKVEMINDGMQEFYVHFHPLQLCQ